MKIIDVHTHIYPDRIAQKASEAIGEFYDRHMYADGRAETLLRINEEYGIGISVVHSVATTPQQVESINSFIADTVRSNPGRLAGFATMHPDFDRVEEEVERIRALGLTGIKIHPDFQKFDVDGKKAFRIYEVIESRLPMLIHTGDRRYAYSKPRRILNIRNSFPGLTMICAHFGGYSEWEEASRMLAGREIMVDTSSSLSFITKEQARRYIDSYGVDNVLFGSDYPMWNPGDELGAVKGLGLTAGDLDKVLHKNAERVLGFQVS